MFGDFDSGCVKFVCAEEKHTESLTDNFIAIIYVQRGLTNFV